jgi:hypothetical protein
LLLGEVESKLLAEVGQRHEELAGKIWEMETELENFLLENTGLQGWLNPWLSVYLMRGSICCSTRGFRCDTPCVSTRGSTRGALGFLKRMRIHSNRLKASFFLPKTDIGRIC